MPPFLLSQLLLCRLDSFFFSSVILSPFLMSSEADDHVRLSSLTLFSEKVHASEVFVDGWMSLNHAMVPGANERVKKYL